MISVGEVFQGCEAYHKQGFVFEWFPQIHIVMAFVQTRVQTLSFAECEHTSQ